MFKILFHWFLPVGCGVWAVCWIHSFIGGQSTPVYQGFKYPGWRSGSSSGGGQRIRNCCTTHWQNGCRQVCLFVFFNFQFVSFMSQYFQMHFLELEWHRRIPILITYLLNTLRPRRNEQHFADDIFKRIFFNENVWISIKISLKFVPKGPINNIPSLVQIMAWRRWGDKPLSEPMMVSLPTHIFVTRPQWVNYN